MKVQLETELEMPCVPNFILIKQSAALRQEGFRESPKIHIKDLPRDVLLKIANQWTKELITKAGYAFLEAE